MTGPAWCLRAPSGRVALIPLPHGRGRRPRARGPHRSAGGSAAGQCMAARETRCPLVTPRTRLNSAGNASALRRRTCVGLAGRAWAERAGPCSRAAAARAGAAGRARGAPEDRRQPPRPRRDHAAEQQRDRDCRARRAVRPQRAQPRRLRGPAPAAGGHAAEQVAAVVRQEQHGHPQVACARVSTPR